MGGGGAVNDVVDGALDDFNRFKVKCFFMDLVRGMEWEWSVENKGLSIEVKVPVLLLALALALVAVVATVEEDDPS
jgi:hypothetical protein